MYNLLISLAVTLLVTALLHLLAGVPLWLAALIGLLVFAGAMFLLTRWVMKKIGVIMEVAQKDIQAGRVEKAIKTMQSGLKYGAWQFYVNGQIQSQIGMIYYLKRDFPQAFEYLQQSFVRNWAAMGMLAICYMKRNKPAKMIDAFEKAAAANKKEPLLWNLYGYCLEKIGEKDKAVAAMEKGLKKVGGHELLETNLRALKEGRKMKMMEWGELWYQFQLENQGAIIKQQTRAVQGRRKVVRR